MAGTTAAFQNSIAEERDIFVPGERATTIDTHAPPHNNTDIFPSAPNPGI